MCVCAYGQKIERWPCKMVAFFIALELMMVVSIDVLIDKGSLSREYSPFEEPEINFYQHLARWYKGIIYIHVIAQLVYYVSRYALPELYLLSASLLS